MFLITSASFAKRVSSRHILVLLTPLLLVGAAAAASLILNGGSQTLDGTQAYDYINITNGGILYVTAYNGAGTTGRLILNINEIDVDGTSSIIGTARGYTGGAGGSNTGSGYGGTGGMVASQGGGSNGANGGFYYVGGGAGGGGYGTAGGTGGAGHGSLTGSNAAGGIVTGTLNGLDIDMGSGGGGGGGSTPGHGAGGSGSPGGAMFTINADTINIHGTVNFNGGAGGAGGAYGGAWGGGGGGGASGGGILFKAKIINLSSAVITANGGSGGSQGGSGYSGGNGGAGGGGRIKLFYSSAYNANGATISAGTVALTSGPGQPTALTASTGKYWVQYTWAAGASTDSFNVLFNGAWTNGSSATFINNSVGAHGWGNISVYGYNSTYGMLGSPASANTQVPNSPITISGILDSYNVEAGQTLSIDANYSDADGDKGVFARNFSNGIFNASTGILTWDTAIGDAGTYNLRINVSDGYGSVDTKSFTVAVSPDTTRPAVSIQSPANITYTAAAVPVSFTATDNIAVDACTVFLNGAINSTTCSNYTLTLGNGAYILNVTANDTAGNINSSAVSFAVAMPSGLQSNSTPATTDANGIAAANVSFSFTPNIVKINTGAQEQSKALRASAGVNKLEVKAKVTLSGQAVAGKQVIYTISE